MRKLALDDDILLNIEKPARYIGGEVNAVMKEKNWKPVRLRYALPCAFPMSMRSECRTSVFRSYMICSTAERMYGVSVSIHHGWISTRS